VTEAQGSQLLAIQQYVQDYQLPELIGVSKSLALGQQWLWWAVLVCVFFCIVGALRK
jgi:hypothetical protein